MGSGSGVAFKRHHRGGDVMGWQRAVGVSEQPCSLTTAHPSRVLAARRGRRQQQQQQQRRQRRRRRRRRQQQQQRRQRRRRWRR
eukprot:gene22104-biopygen8718